MNNNKICSCSCCESKKNENQHNHNKNKSKRILTIIGAAIFIGAFFVSVQTVSKIMFIAAYLFIGREVLLLSFKNILKGKVFDENFLMSVATIAALCIGEYPEAAAVMLFYNIGMYFEDLALDKSRGSIADLMNIRPDFVFVRRGDTFIKTEPEIVSVGTEFLVKAGEKIPLDGIIIEGSSIIDMSALNGESLPKNVSVGGLVLSGSINVSANLIVKASKIFEESTASKILNLVENAAQRKTKTENFITQFARYYTPAVVGLAILLASLPSLLFGAPFEVWLNRALIFLVMSCPCALVISIPLSYFAGIGGASKQGILIKGSNYLDALSKTSAVVFDKTGTLTKGKFKVIALKSQNNFSADDLLKTAAYAEHYNAHPIALSIKEAYKENIDEKKIKNYRQEPGMGLYAEIDDKKTILGNAAFLKKNGINISEISDTSTVVHISIDGAYAGYIEIADEIKSDSKEAIAYLKNNKIKTFMLTGDIKLIGEKVANDLQIDEVYTNLLPHQKAQKIEEIKNSAIGSLVFMGDGINDAPVLALADIGIAMGALGSDAAIEAADIVFMNDEPSKIITALKIAKNTKAIVIQNITFALSVKAIVLVLAVLGMAQMWAAVFADVGVTMIAVLNAMRAMKN
ncbi:MAG: cadmium-translocating P-type ATPase [Elusimicrobiota bacterium]|jgi:Cd2+/Zn2+-exporting ATPase|nr:cadmium-translocating P-type ATPase [Elusimicrobiota bacterium]